MNYFVAAVRASISTIITLAVLFIIFKVVTIGYLDVIAIYQKYWFVILIYFVYKWFVFFKPAVVIEADDPEYKLFKEHKDEFLKWKEAKDTEKTKT